MSNDQSTLSSHSTDKVVHNYLPIVLNPDSTITRVDNFPITPADPHSSSSPVLTKDLPLNPLHNTWLRIFLPRQQPLHGTNTKLPLIVYFHGGGFIICSAASTFFHNFCVEMAIQVGVVIVSVDYRLAPEHRLPAAYEDAMDALHWVKTSPDVWLRDSADISNCFLVGTSAGGNIAYHAGLRAAAAVDDLVPLKIIGLVLHDPAFGGSTRTGSEIRLVNDLTLPRFLIDLVWGLAMPIGADRDHEYSNPTMEGESQHSLEKLRLLGWKVMITACEGDPMVDRQMELAKGLEKKGLAVVAQFAEGGYHGIMLADRTKAEAFFVSLKDFVHGSASKQAIVLQSNGPKIIS